MSPSRDVLTNAELERVVVALRTEVKDKENPAAGAELRDTLDVWRERHVLEGTLRMSEGVRATLYAAIREFWSVSFATT